MIRLNPRNETVPPEALRESAVEGCQRAYFLISEDLSGKDVLIVDGKGRAFKTAVKNLLLMDAGRVESMIASGTTDWETIGIPGSVRVLSIDCPFDYPDDAFERSPMVEPEPEVVVGKRFVPPDPEVDAGDVPEEPVGPEAA